MKALFDTSVLVASVLKNHVHHVEAAVWHAAARDRSVEVVVSAHTLAEMYVALTKMPHGMNLAPSEVWKVIDADVLPHATLRTLSVAGYSRLVRRLADEGVVGAAIYDAVIAEVARLAKVDAVVTFNVRHFTRFWPADRVLSPLTSSPSDFL